MAYWEMSRRALSGGGSVGVALFAALGCARFGYEPLLEGSLAPLPNDSSLTHAGGLGGASGADDGGTGRDGVSVDGGTASGSGTRLDAGDTGPSGVDADVSEGGAGSSALAGCGPAAPTATWSYANDGEGWQVEVDPGASGNLSWTGAAGDPGPGALQIDATVANDFNNVRVYLDLSPSNFTGKVLYAHVFLESGSGVSAKAFVQAGGGSWGDGQEVHLDAQQWHCVSFDPGDPVTSTPGFDRTAVGRIGIFFFGNASSRLYVDQVSY